MREREDAMKHGKLRWNHLSDAQKTTVLVVASVQVSLAVTAWLDLAARLPEEVNGRKAMWAAIIAINVIGPALYFARGVRK
jgi:low temperature requirement protein LtrA